MTWSCAGYAVAFCRDSRVAAAGFWLGMAGGFLSKGLIGIGVPAATAIGFSSLLLLGRWTGRYQGPIAPRVGWLTGPVLMLAPIAAWLVAVEHAGGGSAYEILRQSLFRFGSENAAHASSWHLYFTRMPSRTFPLIVAADCRRLDVRRKGRPRPAGRRVPVRAGLAGPDLHGTQRRVGQARALSGPPAAGRGAARGDPLGAAARALRDPAALGMGWIALMCVSATVYAARDTRRISREPLLRDVLDYVSSQREGRPLGLYVPTYRLSGAAVFYTGEFMPTVVEDVRVPEVLDDASSALLIGELRAAEPLPDLSSASVRAKPLRKFPFGDTNIIVWQLDRTR